MEMTEIQNPIAEKQSLATSAAVDAEKPQQSKASPGYAYKPEELGNLTSVYESDKKNAVELLNDPDGKFKSIENLYAGLKTSPQRGIDSSTVGERADRFGLNELPQKEFPSFCELVVEAVFYDPVMVMLLVAAIVSIAIGIYSDVSDAIRGYPPHGEWAEGLAILATVIFVAFLQAGIDFAKNKVFQAQQLKSADKDVKVIRDGDQKTISVYNIVVGDIMLFEYGEQLPVDAIYIEGDDVKVDEAALTGEPDELKKSSKSPFLLGGTNVVSGSGRALVVGVGINSAQGRIAVALQADFTFVPIEGKARVEFGSEKVVFTPKPAAGKFGPFKRLVMGMEKIKLVTKQEVNSPTAGKNIERAESEKEGKEGEEEESTLQAGEHYVTSVTNLGKKNGGIEEWELTLKIPFDGPSEKGVDLFVAEEEEEASKSVLERKLGKIALLIGYFGMIVAGIALITLIIRWIIVDFSCAGPSGSLQDGASEAGKCGRPFYASNWYSTGPSTKSYQAFSKRYCNNVSYPARTDWQHLCEEYNFTNVESGEFKDCPLLVGYDGTGRPNSFYGEVKVCTTAESSTAEHESYSYPYSNGTVVHNDRRCDGRLSFGVSLDGQVICEPNMKWQRWTQYCKKGDDLSKCSDEELEPAYQHLTDIQNIVGVIITCITILVVAIPEGLPLAVVLALVYSSTQMSKKETNCFVKELSSCETMGNATAICSDKTGTLTRNRMTVERMHIAGKVFTSAPAGGEIADSVKQILGECLLLNSGEGTDVTRPTNGGEDDYKGNASECGLLAYAMDLQFDKNDYRPTDGSSKYLWPKGVRLFPFRSDLKRMSIVVPRFGEDGSIVGTRILTKGASEQVVELCGSHLSSDGEKHVWGENKRDEITKLTDQAILPFAARMLRTFGLCYKDLDIMPDTLFNSVEAKNDEAKNDAAAEPLTYFQAFDDDSQLLQDMTLVAIVGLEDGIRPEVPEAVKKCKMAGITVRMCTGDNIFTAKAISDHCGLIPKDCQLEKISFKDHTGKELSTNIVKDKGGNVVGMEGKYFRAQVWNTLRETYQEENEDDPDSDLVFDKLWPKLRVLARCSPEDKLILVRGLKNSELFRKVAAGEEGFSTKEQKDISKYPEVVAVTGDGTNDAPALKAADVGFAMGIAGTDIAKNACDIVLMDDNFASIVKAVKWGRNVYDSIAKFLQFQLTVNVVAIVVAFVGACYNGNSPLTAVQLLWINLIMDSLASLALATEKPTDKLLERKPIGKTKSIMSMRMYRFIASSAVYQIIIILAIYFSACQGERGCQNGYVGDPDARCDGWMRCASGHDEKGPTVHYTIVFHTFTLMQIFNEINARQLGDELNIFAGIHTNIIFIGIWFGTVFTQIFIVEILNAIILAGGAEYPAGNSIFNTTNLSWDQWLICILFGICGNIFGILARFIKADCFKKCADAGDYKDDEEMAQKFHEADKQSSVLDSFVKKNVTGKKKKASANKKTLGAPKKKGDMPAIDA